MIIKKNKVVVSYIILTVVAVLFLIPFIWMIQASLDENATLAIRVPQVTLANFSAVFHNAEMMRSFLNSFIISFGQSVIVVILSLLAAYPLSRYKLRFKRSLMFFLLFLTGLPTLAIMVPVYQLFFYLKFNDSLIATTVFMASAAFPIAIWMTKNFMDSIPMELEESAWIDGAGTLRGLFTIIMPLMLPGLFTVFIYVFIGAWGNFVVPFILINSTDKIPASVTIYQFFSQYGMINYGGLAAFSTMYAVPAIVLYTIAQKFMSAGFRMEGASKQ